MRVSVTNKLECSTNGGYTAPSTSDFELSTLLDVFQETEIRHRENSLIPIMKDILKYQYAPLKQVAVVVMHRLFNDSQGDLVKCYIVLAVFLYANYTLQSYSNIYQKWLC